MLGQRSKVKGYRWLLPRAGRTFGDMAEVARAKKLLKKVRDGAQFGNIQLKDVEEVLADEAFLTAEGLLTANDNGVFTVVYPLIYCRISTSTLRPQSTLLHLAAQTKVLAVLPLVSEEYKRLKVFSDAMLKLNNTDKNPLHVAIAASRYENVLLLFKECINLCPKALESGENGE